MAMLEMFVVNKEEEQLKGLGQKMTREMKKEYIVEWIDINKDMLQYGGLGTLMIGEEEPQFCGGTFLLMNYSKQAVMYLQDVMFQADVAHMNFGKYTLYSCYGI